MCWSSVVRLDLRLPRLLQLNPPLSCPASFLRAYLQQRGRPSAVPQVLDYGDVAAQAAVD